MTRAFIGLGSNLGDRREFLKRALLEIDALPETELIQVSSFYDTDPSGSPGPNYLNAVATVSTGLDAEQLLWNLQRVESRLGRPPAARSGPRVIDLDLLFHGSAVVERPGLQLPHPRFRERLFVLVPMAELCPEWTDPVTGLRVDQLVQRRRPQDSVRWAGRIKL